MNVEFQRVEGDLVLSAEGRVDGTNASNFQEAIQTAIQDTDQTVVFDFEKLSYISSAGLRAILVVAKTLQQKGVSFAACSMTESVREVFVISGFDKIIPVYDDHQAAISSFRS